jgi:hypothetical protein
MSEHKPVQQQGQINFTIVPDETNAPERVYANFCTVAHTPFDFTLTFCEVMPPTQADVQTAGPERVLRAPVKARLVVPVQFLPNLAAMLQEHMRVYGESMAQQVPWKDPIH